VSFLHYNGIMARDKREIIVSKHVNVSILPSILDIVTDFVVFSCIVLY